MKQFFKVLSTDVDGQVYLSSIILREKV